MQNHRPRNHFSNIVQAVTLLILLGVAVKRFVDWMQKQQKTKESTSNDLIADVLRFVAQIQQGKSVTKPVHRAVDVSRQVREVMAARSQQTKAAKAVQLPKSPAKPKRKSAVALNQRQQKIYDVLQDQGELTMQNIIRAAGNGVSSRTLRRDMTHLEKIGLISQSGRTKNSVYKLV
jgi:predicted HTH transcriptional regulator